MANYTSLVVWQSWYQIFNPTFIILQLRICQSCVPNWSSEVMISTRLTYSGHCIHLVFPLSRHPHEEGPPNFIHLACHCSYATTAWKSFLTQSGSDLDLPGTCTNLHNFYCTDHMYTYDLLLDCKLFYFNILLIFYSIHNFYHDVLEITGAQYILTKWVKSLLSKTSK